MRWELLNGKLIWKKDDQYRIDWDGKSLSKQQFKVKQFLKQFCFNHVVFEEYTLPGTLLKVDFLNSTKKFAVEHHGAGHLINGYSKFFHNNNRGNYLRAIKRDYKKQLILEKNGYILVETFPEDLEILSRQWFIDKYNIYL